MKCYDLINLHINCPKRFIIGKICSKINSYITLGKIIFLWRLYIEIGGSNMVTTVNSAFEDFMKNKVNLDPERTKKARKSRDNLISNIHDLDSKNDFFNLYNDIDISFGSFARRTKIRPLDDIDIMIGIMGDKSTYYESSNEIKIYVHDENSPQNGCCNENTNILNSTKVINKFITQLKDINDYKKAETHKNGSAAKLQLKSYDWNFDIVPCFMTSEQSDGRSYYLIADGKGNWLKTDPRKDRDMVSELNQKHDGVMLETIRLVKYWNKRPTMPSIPSYTLECLLLQYFNGIDEVSKWIDCRFRDILLYISNNIWNSINDPKEIQGNLNTLTYDEKIKISSRAKSDYDKANEAIAAEVNDKDHEKSIKKWTEILGNQFPQYG